jgi:hypothetical protein
MLCKDLVRQILLIDLSVNDIMNFSLATKNHLFIVSDEILWLNFFIKKYGKEFTSSKPHDLSWPIFCRDIYKNETGDINMSLVSSTEIGRLDLVQFFFHRGATSYGGLDWTTGAIRSSRIGNMPLLLFYTDRGANWFGWCLMEASVGGHRHIIDFLINEYKVDRFDFGLEGAAEGGHEDLVDFFISKGANDWEKGMYGAAKGGHKNLVEKFISLGAVDYERGMGGAIDGKQGELFTFFKKKLRI